MVKFNCPLTNQTSSPLIAPELNALSFSSPVIPFCSEFTRSLRVYCPPPFTLNNIFSWGLTEYLPFKLKWVKVDVAEAPTPAP